VGFFLFFYCWILLLLGDIIGGREGGVVRLTRACGCVAGCGDRLVAF
jgi:hypothetical protein